MSKVRPSFIFVTRASGSWGWVQSAFDVFFLFLRDLSKRASSARVAGGEGWLEGWPPFINCWRAGLPLWTKAVFGS